MGLWGASPSIAEGSSDEHRILFPLIMAEKHYRFLAAGHLRVMSAEDPPGLYAPFKAVFPQINAREPDLGVFTGDIVIWGTTANWDAVDADLAELALPVRFAVGNHDVTNRELFVSRYGPTFYRFEHDGDLFIVLDSELDSAGITGEQLVFLQNTLNASSAENVFVFFHKLLWVVEDTPYYALRDELNNPPGYNFQNNFWTHVEPLFRAFNAQVYLIAGDVGVPWAMALFCDSYENIHLIASGMGGAEEENYLIFDVDAHDVQVVAYRLDGQPLSQGHIEAYDLAFYE